MEVDNAPKSAAEEEAPAVADPPTAVPKADDAPAAPAAQAAPAAESKEAPAEAKEAAPAKRKRRSPSSSRSKSRSKSRSRSRSSRSRSRSKSKSKSKSKSRSRSRSRSRDKRRRGGRRSRSRSRSPRRHGSSRGSSGKRHDYKREEQERREQKKEFTRARKESEKRSIVSQLSNDDGWRRSVWIDTSKLTGNIYVNLLAKLQKCGRVEWLKTFDDMDVFVAMFDSESASERALKLAADNMPVSQPSKRIEVLTKTSLTAEKLCKLFKAEDSEEVEGNLVVRFSSIKEAMSAYLNFSKQPIKDEGAEPLAVTLAFFQTRRKD